ncbi:hypothetical protein BGZ76_009944 [Entomortierella beljakovae]|nr:hypothetical protein BGZ76_009944 [Entomortierella beljakovae]
MTKKSRSSKRTKQKSESSVSITDPAMFISPESSSTHSSTIITSSGSSSSNNNNSSTSNSATTTTTINSSITTTITEQSPPSSLTRIQKSETTSTRISPALTVRIVEEESTVESRGGLSSSVTDTTLADIDGEDYTQIEEEYSSSTKNRSSSEISKIASFEKSNQVTMENNRPEEEVVEKEEEELKREAKDKWEKEQALKKYGMKGQDWVVLGALTAATLTVRMWNIQAPGEIVMDEAHVGKYVNGYLTKEFMFDRHPPLGKMILAGVSSITSGYTGSFSFDEIGDAYPKEFPIVALRSTMAVMGALCAPIAFITLKAIGQGIETATAAALLIAFDNALTTNNRLMTLDAPLMFFTSLSFMAWNIFAKQSFRPFSAIWWAWLAATGLATSCALSTKASGLFTFLMIGALTVKDMLNLASTRSIGSTQFIKHLASRSLFLALLPIATYILLFYIHFELQIYRPSDLRSPQGEYDFNQISYPFRDSLYISPLDKPDQEPILEPDQEPMWKDIVYGSVIQLRSEIRPSYYLHSFLKNWPKGSKQQQVSGYEYPDLNTNWIISKVPTDKEKAAGQVDEIPARLRYVRHGDIVKLRHVPTRKCLHSHNVRIMGRNVKERYNEVSAYGSPGGSGDSNDWWVIEVVDGERMVKWPAISPKVKIAALEMSLRFKHKRMKCYLSVTNDMLPDNIDGGNGRRELACLKNAKVNDKSVWRITLNDHDYLPADTELASYSEITFIKKFRQLHSLMLRTPRVFEQSESLSGSSSAVLWPLALSKNIINMWRKAPSETGQQQQDVQQISLIANPIVWSLGILGVLGYLASHAIIMLREKRGYVSQRPIEEFKQRELSDAGILFLGWAISYLPYIILSAKKHQLTTHHYFPALYFSILLSCTLLSGVSRHMLPGMKNASSRLGLWICLSVLAISVFVQISPFTYGTRISPEKYESLEKLIYRKQSQRPSQIISDIHYSVRNSTSESESTESTMTPGWSLLFSENLELPKPKLHGRPPALDMHFPKATDPLPQDDIFMTPCQRPPQLWDINEQKGKPNPYQRQQMRSIMEMIRAEEEEKEKEKSQAALKKQQKAQAQAQAQAKPMKTATMSKGKVNDNEKAVKEEVEEKEEVEDEAVEVVEEEEEEESEDVVENMEDQMDQIEEDMDDQLQQQQQQQQHDQEPLPNDQDEYEANADNQQNTPELEDQIGMAEYTPEIIEASQDRLEEEQMKDQEALEGQDGAEFMDRLGTNAEHHALHRSNDDDPHDALNEKGGDVHQKISESNLKNDKEEFELNGQKDSQHELDRNGMPEVERLVGSKRVVIPARVKPSRFYII